MGIFFFYRQFIVMSVFKEKYDKFFFQIVPASQFRFLQRSTLSKVSINGRYGFGLLIHFTAIFVI